MIRYSFLGQNCFSCTYLPVSHQETLLALLCKCQYLNVGKVANNNVGSPLIPPWFEPLTGP